MIKYILSRNLYNRIIIGICGCLIIFVAGYYVLNHISTMEDPPFGNTIYILIGSGLIFSSAIGVFLILKYLYEYKKKKERRERRRKKHKIFFLKNQNNEKKLD